MDTTDNLIKLVNENSDIVQIAEYIFEFSGKYLEFEEAKKIARYLINEENFKKDEILAGLANAKIFSIMQYKRMKVKSVQAAEKSESKIPFKTVKKKMNPKVIATGLMIIFSISSLAYLKQGVRDYKEDVEVSKLISMITTGNEENKNIVAKNSYGLNHGDERVVAYDNYGIASDIIQVCLQDPKLLDLVLFRTYFDMEYNRLSNMDEVIRRLAFNAKDDDNLKFITDSLDNCSSFVEYIFKKGYISVNDRDYDLYLNAVNEYNSAMSDFKYPYNNLSKETKNLIDNLISEYRKDKSDLYSEYKDNLGVAAGISNDDLSKGGRK